MKRLHDTPRTDAVLNTFDGKASKLAADLATHAEELERELTAVTEQRDELKALLTKEQGTVTISRNGYVQELEHALAEARAEMIRWQSIAEGRGRTDDDDMRDEQ